MKSRFSHQRNRALTKIEVMVIVAALAVLAALFLPALPAIKRKSSHLNGAINRISHVKLIGLADGPAWRLTNVLIQVDAATNRLIIP
jgi:Tfp pilus assembly protein FimT